MHRKHVTTFPGGGADALPLPMHAGAPDCITFCIKQMAVL